MKKLLLLTLLLGVGFCLKVVINSTSDFDAGIKVNTSTATDRYNITENALEVDFPYAEKDENLLHYWRFENNSNDETGNANGTVVGNVTTVTGYFGKGYHFDGEGSYVNFNNSGKVTEAYTVTLWVKLEDNSVYRAPIWRGLAGDNDYHTQYYIVFRTPTYSDILFRQGTGSSVYTVSTSYTESEWIGKWHFLAQAWNGTHLSGYVDGNSVGTVSATSIATDPDTLLVGGAQLSGITAKRDWNGSIDEVKIYNRSLSEDEIKKLYNHGLQYINTTATWESQNTTTPNNQTIQATTIQYQNTDQNNYIQKIQWLTNGTIKAEYNQTITQGNQITITNDDLTTGNYNQINTNHTIKIYIKTNGTKTPTITKIIEKTGDCGEVVVYSRYGNSSADTVIPSSGVPFTTNDNPQVCYLGAGENCSVGFVVNATDYGDYYVDVLANSSLSFDDSVDVLVRVISAALRECDVILNDDFTSIITYTIKIVDNYYESITASKMSLCY